jgi:hypothetical protein
LGKGCRRRAVAAARETLKAFDPGANQGTPVRPEFRVPALRARDPRGFYGVIASYYALFAVMGAPAHALVLESLVGAVFLAAAAFGFRGSLWLVVAALAAHGIFDLTHHTFIANAGVPVWWPDFCLAYDLTAAAYLAWLLRSGRIRAAA